MELLVTVIAVETTALAVASMQFKSMRYVITFQLLANLCLVAQYILQGQYSAAYICIPAIVQMLVGFVLSLRGINFPVWLTVVFIAVYTGTTVITYASPFDILTCAAVWFFALSIIQTRSYICRAFSVCNLTLWLIYDIFCAPPTILTHAVILACTLFGVIRLDLGEWKRIFSGKAGKSEK